MTDQSPTTVARLEVESMRATLQQIALGKPIDGKPIAGEAARQLARDVLVDLGYDWPRVNRHPHEPSTKTPETPATS